MREHPSYHARDLLLYGGQDVRVDLELDRNPGVPQSLAHDFDVDAMQQEMWWV